MHIKELRLENFRNFSAANLFPCPSLNFIVGHNGAGKSSLLEAIHLLGFGRSFRTKHSDNCIRLGESQLAAFCEFAREKKNTKIGLTRSKREGFLFSIDGERTKRIADIVRLLPVQILTPQSSDLILGSPIGRRRYIDWLLFHVEHSFQSLSSRYVSCLQQRNSLLKQFNYSQKEAFLEQDVWLQVLSTLGEQISKLRVSHVERLSEHISTLFKQFYPEFNVTLRYNQGWESGLSLFESLSKNLERDLFRGNSGRGPHKGDILFLIDDRNAAEFLSRGQLRVLTSLLLLSEVILLKQYSGKPSIFLIDDLAAELDEVSRKKFVDLLVQNEAQVFITCIHQEQMQFANHYNNKKMFHVEHDQVNEE